MKKESYEPLEDAHLLRFHLKMHQDAWFGDVCFKDELFDGKHTQNTNPVHVIAVVGKLNTHCQNVALLLWITVCMNALVL